MELTDLLLPPEIWAATPAAAQALIVAPRERIRDLEARLGQNSTNSSRPPSSDPIRALARPKAPPSGRQRGGHDQRVSWSYKIHFVEARAAWCRSGCPSRRGVSCVRHW
jgi:hypothetical protein